MDSKVHAAGLIEAQTLRANHKFTANGKVSWMMAEAERDGGGDINRSKELGSCSCCSLLTVRVVQYTWSSVEFKTSSYTFTEERPTKGHHSGVQSFHLIRSIYYQPIQYFLFLMALTSL